MTLFKPAPQHPSLSFPPGERLILLKALCSLFATLIPKIPSVMSLDTNTHGPFNFSDSGKKGKCRKLGQISLIITRQAMEFWDRLRTGASNGDHWGRQNMATDSWWEYSYLISKMKFSPVSSGCSGPRMGHMDGEAGAVREIQAHRVTGRDE